MADEDDVKTAYEKARAELITALQKKRAVDRSLVRCSGFNHMLLH